MSKLFSIIAIVIVISASLSAGTISQNARHQITNQSMKIQQQFSTDLDKLLDSTGKRLVRKFKPIWAKNVEVFSWANYNINSNSLTSLNLNSRTGDIVVTGAYVLEDASLICLGGKVSGRDLADLGFIECLEHSARDRDCIIDLRNVSLLESSAIIALGPFLPWRAGTSARVLFSGASANVLQMFRMVGLGEPEHFIGDSDLLAMICDGSLAN